MLQQAEDTTKAVSNPPPVILEEKKGRFKVKNVRHFFFIHPITTTCVIRITTVLTHLHFEFILANRYFQARKNRFRMMYNTPQ